MQGIQIKKKKKQHLPPPRPTKKPLRKTVVKFSLNYKTFTFRN